MEEQVTTRLTPEDTQLIVHILCDRIRSLENTCADLSADKETAEENVAFFRKKCYDLEDMLEQKKGG